MKKSILLLLFLSISLNAQDSLNNKIHNYNFIIMDSPAKLFTMRQSNQNYLSLYRIFSKELDELINDNTITDFVKLGVLFFTLPITHEEGHRSILTAKNIGSISQPFINSKGAAYVVGVENKTLKNLRDNDLPTYLRLHSAGLESDYMITNRTETIIAFEKEKFNNIWLEYYYRKASIITYFLTGLFKSETDIKKEKNELDRDIVGHDIYGFVRHIYRPQMEFYRYTNYKDLQPNEKKLVKRLGYRSFLNLLNPIILNKPNFSLSTKIKGNLGIGHAMSPFGDFIDENIWLMINNKFNINFYARQFQNESNWFYGFGLGIYDFEFLKNISTTIKAHYWNQPKKLNFFTNESFSGGAIDFSINYNFYNNSKTYLKGMGVNIGLLYKSFGFLPEEVMLDKHFGFSLGTIIKI